MNGFGQLLRSSLLLHFRNRLALIYGYLFPAIFLASFLILYRHEPVPLIRHFGQLITITILGSACFGLPTTLVSERERGMWRRYRLMPVPLGRIILGTVTARYVIILGATLLQVGIAMGVGMPSPAHPLQFAVSFTLVAFAFLGSGLMIAAMADNVPAVQALGQCIFLPMLIIGGVAVPLSGLPEWAQTVSGFFPGRYAVETLQACTEGTGLNESHFDLLALAVLGTVGCCAGTKLFRWDAGQHFRSISGKIWLIPALVAWLAIGVLVPSQKTAPSPPQSQAPAVVKPPAPPPMPVSAVPPPVVAKTWSSLSTADIDGLNYSVPDDAGVVTPIAQPDERPDESTEAALNTFQVKLVDWAPAHVSDPVQRTLNLLSVAGAMDLAQDPIERYVPLLIYGHLTLTTPHDQLVQQLAWIVLHPEQGDTANDLTELGLGGVPQTPLLRERVNLYAIKFIIRLTDRKPTVPKS